MGTFFMSWELWQQMTFVLGCAIAAVFIAGLGKLWYLTNKVRQHEREDIEKRAHTEALVAAGIPLPTKRRFNIPFGIRAIEVGIEVDGVWVSSNVSSLRSESLQPGGSTSSNKARQPRTNYLARQEKRRPAELGRSRLRLSEMLGPENTRRLQHSEAGSRREAPAPPSQPVLISESASASVTTQTRHRDENINTLPRTSSRPTRLRSTRVPYLERRSRSNSRRSSLRSESGSRAPRPPASGSAPGPTWPFAAPAASGGAVWTTTPARAPASVSGNAGTTETVARQATMRPDTTIEAYSPSPPPISPLSSPQVQPRQHYAPSRRTSSWRTSSRTVASSGDSGQQSSTRHAVLHHAPTPPGPPSEEFALAADPDRQIRTDGHAMDQDGDISINGGASARRAGEGAAH